MSLDTFDRPTGAHADVAEIEYISALHQTGWTKETRTDGSIRAVDIRYFLASRYGIRLSIADIEQHVLLHGYGFDVRTTTTATAAANVDNDNDGNPRIDNNAVKQNTTTTTTTPPTKTTAVCMDLAQLVSVLLIPHFLEQQQQRQQHDNNDNDPKHDQDTKHSQSHNEDEDNNNDESLFPYMLGRILQDCTGSTRPRPLTPALVKQILRACGEEELSRDDQLVQEMVDCASSGDDNNDGAQVDLNLTTFTRALTGDIQLWDYHNYQKESLNYDDVLETATSDQVKDIITRRLSDVPGKKDEPEDDDDDEERNINNKDTSSRHDNEKKGWMVKAKMPAFVQRIPVAQTVDFAVDSFMSKLLVVFLWASFLVSFFAYYFNSEDDSFWPACEDFALRETWSANRQAMGCAIGVAVLRWLYIVAVMGLYGVVYIGGSGLGNSVNEQNPFYPIVATGISILFTVGPFVLFHDAGSKEQAFLDKVALSLGLVVVLLNLHICYRTISRAKPHDHWEIAIAPNGFVAEARNKQAAKHKIDRMVRNAVDLSRDNLGPHSHGNSYFGRSLGNFVLKTNQNEERIGGLFWTWKKIRSRELFSVEGVWLSSRLLASNLVHVFIAIFVLLGGIVLTMEAVQQHDENYPAVDNTVTSLFHFKVDPLVEKLGGRLNRVLSTFVGAIDVNCTASNVTTRPSCNTVPDINDCLLAGTGSRTDFLCTLSNYVESTSVDQYVSDVQNQLLEGAGLPINYQNLLLFDTINEGINDSISSLYPEERFMVTVPFAIATLAAFITAIVLAVELIPSAVTTVLKFRCGALPSLHDPLFHVRKIAPNLVIYYTGQMFWGILISSLLMGLLFGSVVFLFVWQVTASTAQWLLAMLIGLGIIVLAQFLISFSSREATSKCYYRDKPLSNNLAYLAQECAIYAISIGFMAARTAKLILVATLYSGRINRKILSDENSQIKQFEVELDVSYTVFLIDLLQKEAHRHPYLELLGAMYLMKVVHKDRFATRAGCCWRLVYTSNLMTWLCRYRRAAREHGTMKAQNSVPLLASMIERDGAIVLDQFNPRTGENIAALRKENERLRALLQRAGIEDNGNTIVEEDEADNDDDDGIPPLSKDVAELWS